MKVVTKPTWDVSSKKNPFDDFNANVLSPETIMKYWYPPFSTGALPDLNEKEFLSGKMPIILQGARGTGKTTILKYYSYSVQSQKAKNEGRTILQQLAMDGGVGFYLRCDDAFIDIFKAVFQNCQRVKWEQCFKHYLELFFSSNILSLINDILKEKYIEDAEFVKNLKLNEISASFCFRSINELDGYISEELRYILRYKNDAPFLNNQFSPRCLLDFYEISGRLIQNIKKYIPEIRDILFLLFIDEFEVLSFDLQNMFNTLIKYCKEGMSLRIGRRSEKESVISKETVNKEEYLKENSDYRLIRMNFHDVDKGKRKKYLANIAQKRLELFFNEPGIQISDVIGETEDLDWECSMVAGRKTKHLHNILKQNPRLYRSAEERKMIVNIVNNPERVIGSAICALWVARSKEDNLFKIAQEAVGAMTAYFEKKDHPLLSKFRNDYINKYRYAITVFVCSVYKKDKMYYGFNTISYLSEGNARVLINLMKTMLSDSLFYEHDEFIRRKVISKISQNRATHEFAISEFESTCSIIHEGRAIRQLLQGIGNVLSTYHKDPLLRYPETTQFYYPSEQLNQRDRDIVETAEGWVLLNRNLRQHRMSAGVVQQANLYSLNRVFCPIFNISYRTRGGVNVMFSEVDIDKLIHGEDITKLPQTVKKDRLPRAGDKVRIGGYQLSMFDGGVK